jgi:hypothetical protein
MGSNIKQPQGLFIKKNFEDLKAYSWTEYISINVKYNL